MASLLVPVLAAVALLYQGLSAVAISVGEGATLLVVAGTLAIATVLGLAAARGGERIRVTVFAATTVVLLDMTVHPSRLFDAIYPSHRLAVERDERRVADLHQIKDALDAFIRKTGSVPPPSLYGEGTGPQTFWAGWWDVSAVDGNGDGRPFMEFLETPGVPVPVDPLNTAPDPTDPRYGSSQYVYFVVQGDYPYYGGQCEAWAGKTGYLLGLTRFETEGSRRPDATADCSCLWRDAPNFFQQYFPYVLCGTAPR